jgi:hypothetical protein
VSESRYRLAGLSVQSKITSYDPRSERAFVGASAPVMASTWRRELILLGIDTGTVRKNTRENEKRARERRVVK